MKTGLDLKGAQKELASRQQARLRKASADINTKVGISGAREVNIIGAWENTAENSIMSRSDAGWDRTALAAVMKGHLADQKAVLVFEQADDGNSMLVQFEAKGPLTKIHRDLNKAGLKEHTLVPKEGGATVYIIDVEGGTARVEQIDKVAQKYGEDNNVYVQTGRAEFIGNTDYSGTDRQQRDRARAVYERVIRESPVEKAEAIWEDVRSNWSAAAPAKEQRWLSGSEDDAAYVAKIDVGEVEAKTKANVKAAAASSSVEPLPGSKADHPSTIASRNPTAKGTKKNPAPPPVYGQPDVASMKTDPEAFDHNVNLFRNEKFYSNFRAEDLAGTSDEAVRHVVDQMKANLKFMYSFSEKNTEVWYDGARALVDDRAKLYGFNDASIAGVYAALSPMKDWDQNVHIADKLLETYKTKQDFTWSQEMDDVATGLWSSKNQKVVDAVRGKKLSELKTPEEKALWIRTYDETHNDQEYRTVLPDGSLGNIATNKDGSTSKVVWQSLPAIKNAVIALEANGDHEIISGAMGTAHKVRSFYNNILDPHSKNDDVTIDTHAVGAALLRNLAGSDAAVMQNFGNAPEQKDKPEGWEAASNSIKTGLSGTYAVYAQAYREAAKELGIQGRQLQSAVWVVKREAFGALSDKQSAAVEKAWESYRDGDASLESTRAEIAKIAGLKKRTKDAGWIHRDAEEGWRGGDARELYRSRVGWDAVRLVGGARGDAPRGASGLVIVQDDEGRIVGIEVADEYREEDHPRGEDGRWIASAAGEDEDPELDAVMSREEIKRFNELEESYKNHTPEEAAEYKALSEKYDKRWTLAVERQARRQEEEYEAQRVTGMKQQATAVANTLGFPPERIDFVKGTRTFDVNGVPHTAGGDADIYNPSGEGRIRLYQDHIHGSEALAGVTAHEIEHFKVQAAINAYQADYKQVMKDPGPAPDPGHQYWWGKKGGTDAMMSPSGALKPPYDKKYPYYTAMHEALYQHPTSEFAEGDGVSKYSAEYWKGWHEGTVSTDIAFHETLAEMAKTKFLTDKFPEHYGYSDIIRERAEARPTHGEYPEKQPNKAQGTKMWRNLFRTIEKIHKDLNKGKRQ